MRATRSAGSIAFYRGITITRAWGDMTRYGITSECDAFGIGPTYLMRIGLKQWQKASFSLEMSSALIFYDENFPTGGDFYDFMWRIGPKFGYRITEDILLIIGYKLMHVSNGQLYWPELKGTARNPAYNAQGWSISVVRCF